MPVSAKICGISTCHALDAALAGGASHVGFVFFPKSPRNVSADKAASLAERSSGRAKVVGLFVDPEPGQIDAIRAQVRLDAIQLHGSEHPALVSRLRSSQGIEVWKAIAVRTKADVDGARKFVGAATRVLFDAKPPHGADVPGGQGVRFDWRLLEGVDQPLPWVLAGGLDARNVGEAVRMTGATLVDVSSGVETTPGIKDVDKIAAFLKATRS